MTVTATPGKHDSGHHHLRQEYQLNLEKTQRNNLDHAARARAGQLENALIRKNETGQFLAAIRNHIALSGMAVALAPRMALAPVAAGVNGGLAAAAGSGADGIALRTAISELGAAVLGLAKHPLGLGIGLLAYSGEVGKGSDKVPGRDLAQRFAVAPADTSEPAAAPRASVAKGSTVKNNQLDRGVGTAVGSATVAGAAGHGGQLGSKGNIGIERDGAVCEGTREQCAVCDGTRGLGRTELPLANDNLVGGKLESPVPNVNAGTTLTTPDQRGGQGARTTGNVDGKLHVVRATTVTPIPEGPNKDDLLFLAEGGKPANMSPDGAGRSGAFNEAKRQSGIPVSQIPSRTLPNVDKRGKLQPGCIYEFDIPKPGGGIQKIKIRDDANGHFFCLNNPQNRGPHFNDAQGNHYDY